MLPGFARDLAAGRQTSVQVLVDGTNSNTASIISGYANTIVSRYANKVMQQRQQSRMVGRTMATGGAVTAAIPTLAARSRVWFNPDLRSRNYYVPGIIINIITIVTLMLTAMAIVREKEIGTMEQLMVTPIRPVELIVGKMLPFAIAGLADLAFITTVALLWFKVPLRGSVLLLLAWALLFLMSTLGVGLFLSTIAQTQQQAMMASFFFFMPAFMLSGFAFPTRNMPLLAQAISYIDPLRYSMEMVRGIFLKGSGVSDLWPQMLALFAFGTAILTVSSLRFRKRLD